MATASDPPPADRQQRRATPSWGPTAIKVGLPLAAAVVATVANPSASRAIVEATLGSPRALLIVAGVIALTVGWSALLGRWVASEWAQAVLVLAPAAIVAAIYMAPYYGGDTVVDDEFPVAVAPAPQGDAPPTPATPGSATPNEVGSADVSSDTGDPDGSAGAPAPTTPAGPTGQPAAQETAAGQAPADAAPAEQPPAEPAAPVELSRGSFVGLDGHYATGEAAIYDLGDGALLVRLEEVDLQPVPVPVLYLVPTADAQSPGEGSINLGALKGNVGNQNYEVPTGTDLAGREWTVLVWCETFASPVGAATQT